MRASTRLLSIASEPPRKIAALPLLMQSAGGIDRHVGPAFVNDADDAERHAHAAHLDAARARPHVDDRADRIG